MSRGKRWKAISGKRKSRNEYGVNGGQSRKCVSESENSN